MKKKIFILLLLVNCSVFCQEDAWVFFKNKPNSQYYFDNPLQMLSQQSLHRRTIQNITLDVKDVPIYLAYLNQIKSATGIVVLAKSKWMNVVHVRGSQANIAALSTLLFVDHIEYANKSLNDGNRLVINNSKKESTVNKLENFTANFDYGSSATQVQMLKADVLHQQGYTGTGKMVAVFDAGFPGVNTVAPFKRLRDNNLIVGGYDFVNKNPNFYTGNSHGTSVLSNMGGYVEGSLIGTAPDAKYFLCITEDTASENPVEESYWVEAAEVADSLGVDVISSSLGYSGYDNTAYSYTPAQLNGTVGFASRGADIAHSKGIICVVSAGNSGAGANPYVSVPADAINVIAVGAVNASRVKAGFSSIGIANDGRFKPDLMAMGVASVVSSSTGSIVTSNGTSFACPILAGAITSFWSAFPTKTNAEIIQFVKASADKFSTPNDSYGYGIPNFQLALDNVLATNSFDMQNFKVYPNPVQDLLTIEMPVFKSSTITLYNSIAQKVFEKSINNTIQSISLQFLPNGIYFYNINNELGQKNGLLLKN